MTTLFDLADLRALQSAETGRYHVPFDQETRQQHRLAEEELPYPTSVSFVFQEEVSSSEVTRTALSRLRQLWHASGRVVVGQAEKDDTQKTKVGRLFHTFDRIYTEDGISDKRFVYFQLDEKFTFVVLRQFFDHH